MWFHLYHQTEKTAEINENNKFNEAPQIFMPKTMLNWKSLISTFAHITPKIDLLEIASLRNPELFIEEHTLFYFFTYPIKLVLLVMYGKLSFAIPLGQTNSRSPSIISSSLDKLQWNSCFPAGRLITNGMFLENMGISLQENERYFNSLNCKTCVEGNLILHWRPLI